MNKRRKKKAYKKALAEAIAAARGRIRAMAREDGVVRRLFPPVYYEENDDAKL